MSKQNSKKQEAAVSVIPETTKKAWQDFFSAIKERCLNRNFGTLSKSEFDLMLFHYYLQNKQAEVGSRYVSDYDIGRDLGLTIQRVRSLRERDALKQEPDDGWKEYFIGRLQFAYCDENGNVKIPVPDVNVIKEIRNYLENLGLFDDYQLNPKVFQCKAETLVLICLKMQNCTDDDLCKKILDELHKSKDGNMARVIGDIESPLWSAFKRGALNDIKKFTCRIPGLENTCEGMFDALVKKIAK